jgi:hypothetical protein
MLKCFNEIEIILLKFLTFSLELNTVTPHPVSHGRLLVSKWYSPHTRPLVYLIMSHAKRSRISGYTPGMVRQSVSVLFLF